MKDSRPVERIQHSYEHYGKFVRKIFGEEAYKLWLLQKHKRQGGVEHKPHVCTPACQPESEQL